MTPHTQGKGNSTLGNSVQIPACWRDVQSAFDAGIDRLILFGPPGTGKTFAGMYFGDVGRGAHRLVCTDDMTNADVTGHLMPTETGLFQWVNGKALKAWDGDGKLGGRLVVDEIDKAGGDVYATLLAMTDNPESSMWTNDLDGTVYIPRPGFSVVMTTNIENMADLPEALKDRFPICVRIDQPHPDALLRLPEDLRGYALRMADQGDDRISLRSFLAFAKLRETLEEPLAARLVFRDNAKGVMEAIGIDRLALAKTATTAKGETMVIPTDTPSVVVPPDTPLVVKRGRGRPKGSLKIVTP